MKSKFEKLIDELDKFTYSEKFFDKTEIFYELEKIYVLNPANNTSELGRRNSLLSAYKKVLKRQIVKYIADRCVEHFNIKSTTMSFFNHFCETIMGRKVDNRFVIENFANRIKEGKEFIKLEEKRPPSDRIKLKHTYEEMIFLKMYSNKKFDINRFNFSKLYDHQCIYLDQYFKYIGNKNKSGLITLTKEEIAAREEKETIINNMETTIEQEETEPKKRKRL